MKKYELTQYEFVRVRVDHKPSGSHIITLLMATPDWIKTSEPVYQNPNVPIETQIHNTPPHFISMVLVMGECLNGSIGSIS